MSSETLVLFTRETAEEILEAGGTQGWALDPDRARQCAYAVLCRNSRGSGAREPLGSAFLVGSVSSVVPAPGRSARWLVRFDRFARIGAPGVWKSWRNPVRYEDQSRFDLEELVFEPMPEPAPAASSHNGSPRTGLTLEEAKRALAATFGVKPECVEITIRG